MCEGLVFSNVSILIYLMYVEICVKVCDINCWYSSLYCDWSSQRKFFFSLNCSPPTPDMRFVKKFTPPDFQTKRFAPLISQNFNRFGSKKTNK